MMLDFRNYKALVAEEIARLNRHDERDWKWCARVNKGSIKISWGYFEYGDNPEYRFVITVDTDAPDDLCIKATDPYWGTCGYTMIGEKFYQDGSVEDCIIKLFDAVVLSSRNW